MKYGIIFVISVIVFCLCAKVEIFSVIEGRSHAAKVHVTQTNMLRAAVLDTVYLSMPNLS